MTPTASGDGVDPPRTSWILLTMGDRPDALAAAVASIPDDASEVVVVTNGAPTAKVPDVDHVVSLPGNVGIPAGRNAGAAESRGDILVFFDDDAEVVDAAAVAAVLARFDVEPDLGAVCFRIVDPVSGETSQRHVPRLGRSDPARGGDVTSFLGGASAIRRSAFDEAGGLPADFFYALEETDLAWRLIDAGWRVAYDPAAVVHHPRTEISRHGDGQRLTARNRVLLARRLLPWVLAPIYVANWFLLTVARTRAIGDLWAGTRSGLRMPVERRPIRWRTVWRLTRLGRPPII